MRPHWFVHARLFKFVCACSGSFVICVRGLTDSKFLGKHPLGTPRERWEYKINVDLRVIVC
jgi:hypothetical protein